MSRSVTKKENKVPAITDEMRAKYVGAGMEDMTSEDLRPPRLKLLQALSPELDDDDSLRAGMFFHSLDLTGVKEMNIIPIKFFRTYILFGPRDSNDGVLARADDGIHWKPADLVYEHPEFAGVQWRTAKTVKGSGLAEFGSSNPDDHQSAPAATRFANFLCVDADNPQGGLFVLSFYRAGTRSGENFAGQMNRSGIAWNNTYKLSSVKVKNNKGEFFVGKTVPTGKTPDDLWAKCAQVYETLKDRSVVVDYEDEEASESAAKSEPAEERELSF
jgi:hypothetical protein